MEGKLIVIEGSDGCGKETQSKILSKLLNDYGISTINLSFPAYGSKSAGPVEMYLNGELGNMDNLSTYQISVLYGIDRMCTVLKEKIYDKLKEGIWVIADRYTESNCIYQAARYEDESSMIKVSDMILEYEKLSLKIPEADSVFYLNVPRNVSKKLIQKRNNSSDIHEDNDEYMDKINNTGLILAELYDWNVIDCVNDEGLRSKENISSEIFSKVLTKFLYDRNE